MLIGIDNQGNIKQINTITDTTLKQIEVDKYRTFSNMSDIRILNYKYIEFENGSVNITPAIDLKDIDILDLKQSNEDLQTQLSSINALKILKTVSTTQPQDITVIDKTTYLDIIATRNITTQVINNTTYYSYEYIKTSLPKTTDTIEQITAILQAKKDALFSDAEYPAYNTYDANTSSTDLLKLVFALIDANKSLTSRVSTLEAK